MANIPYTVTQLAGKISSLIRANLSAVCVEGEISGFKVYSTGNAYFILKDETAQLTAVWFSFRAHQPNLTFEVADGMKVRITGRVDFYGGRGQCQLIVNKLEPAGQGDLMRRFLELKQRLEEEGLFRPERKRALPFLPQRIAVVTSPTGAVIRDILNVLDRRFPNVQVRLAPVKVQGEDAARQIAHAIEVVNRLYGAGSEWPADLLIVGRGGGSMEDLWPFNEEVVARAVAGSIIPVISAVGHETDFTLCDFAADKRAPTPSAAAELAVPLKSDLERGVMRAGQALRSALEQRMQTLAARVAAVKAAPLFSQPASAVERQRQRLDGLEQRLAHAVSERCLRERERLARVGHAWGVIRERCVAKIRNRLETADRAMAGAAGLMLERRKARLEGAARQLALVNPLAVLDRGYSLTRTADGRLVRSVESVAPGTRIVTQVRDGTFEADVKEVKRDGGKAE